VNEFPLSSPLLERPLLALFTYDFTLRMVPIYIPSKKPSNSDPGTPPSYSGRRPFPVRFPSSTAGAGVPILGLFHPQSSTCRDRFPFSSFCELPPRPHAHFKCLALSCSFFLNPLHRRTLGLFWPRQAKAFLSEIALLTLYSTIPLSFSCGIIGVSPTISHILFSEYTLYLSHVLHRCCEVM